ncbi:MAG: hypothetical protein WAK17_24825 [Candidatus Nitrosopolaris sp.]
MLTEICITVNLPQRESQKEPVRTSNIMRYFKSQIAVTTDGLTKVTSSYHQLLLHHSKILFNPHHM